MKEIIRATEAEILSRLTQAARENGILLTHTHKRFYLRLLDYTTRLGKRTDEGYVIVLSVRDLATALNTPPRTVTQSLNRLLACGAVQRTKGEKTFPPSPVKTTLPRAFYERERK